MSQPQILYGIGTMEQIRKKMTGKYIVKQTDLSNQLKTQIADIVTTGIQSFAALSNMIQLATKSIKEILDKRYGPTWQCIIGQGYAYDITIQSGTFLYMLYNGNLGCLVFKT